MRWGKQPGYVVFAGQKIPLERPRVRTREGQEVELQSYSQLQQDGKLQRAVQERMVSGCPHGTIGEQWRVFWKGTESRKAV
jgi:putative transposase